VVQHDRDQLGWCAAVSGEHTLTFVGEGVQPPRLLVLERCEQGRPPSIGEVLRLVDDDRVEPAPGRLIARERDHLIGQSAFPVVTVVVATWCGTP